MARRGGVWAVDVAVIEDGVGFNELEALALLVSAGPGKSEHPGRRAMVAIIVHVIGRSGRP